MRNIFVIFFLCIAWLIQSNAASIKGQLILDESWSPVIYISVIHSFDDLNTASYDFLRYKIIPDSTGHFEVKNLELEEGDRIYRLHVCKKGDPESSIIIGGKEENFIHFMMNENSQTTLLQDFPLQDLKNCTITGHASGHALSQIFELQKKLETPPSIPSENNREFIKKQVHSEFQLIVDTSSNEVLRLLATHFINESFANRNHIKLMTELQKDLLASNYSGTYYDSFADRLEYLKFKEGDSPAILSPWVYYMILLLIIGIVTIIMLPKTKLFARKDIDKLKLLSSQEKRVFNLLKKGKSNKEISSELHIEVSTVKSHLHKIYSRLGIKSRKEIVEEGV